MTNKKMLAFVVIFVSVLGFAFVGALKPVILNYSIKQYSSQTAFDIKDQKIQLESLHYDCDNQSSKMIGMLSEVLGIDKEDILISLEGGSKPSEMLLSNGILLSDLSEEYSFDIVGSELVRFRA
jgi:hypothetical protein